MIGRNSTIALMYHAVDVPEGPGAEAHYTIALRTLGRHLELARRIGGAVVSGRQWLDGEPGVIFTFDDGHETNYRLSFPALLEAHASADFFVNPRQVGQTGYVTWAQLREMADAGMSIQSHSLDHSFFLTQLSPAQLRDNLRRSRDEIEQHLGRKVTLLAPPGGRTPWGLPEIARQCGYSHVFVSRPGKIVSRQDRVLARMAITAKVGMERLESWLRGGSSLLEAQARYSVLRFAKRALGESTYDWVRTRLLR